MPNIPTIRFDLDDPQLCMDKASSKASEVIDICSTAHKAAHPLVGFCLDSSETLRGLYEVRSLPRSLVENCSTLGEHISVLKRDFPLADSYCLAITLVSSILQLAKTPWLDQPWSKQSIMFLRLRNVDENFVDIKHPYLTSEHGTCKTPSEPCKTIRRHMLTLKAGPSVTKRPAQQERRDQVNMLALAIMLLEINLGMPIESLRRSEDLGLDGEPNVGMDWFVAQRCLEVQVQRGNLTSGFASAIKYCLKCYVDPFASFDNSEYVKSVEERVLKPLECEIQLLFRVF